MGPCERAAEERTKRPADRPGACRITGQKLEATTFGDGAVDAVGDHADQAVDDWTRNPRNRFRLGDGAPPGEK